MKIAVMTKPNMLTHQTRINTLNLLRNDGEYEVFECLFNDMPADTDRVLVFGGDGTVLDAVRMIGGRDIAVLGVNLGNMGFLTAYEQDALAEDIVETVKRGACSERMLLDIDLPNELQIKALNELVIKSAGTRPITVDVSVDGKFADSFHSDGIIVASPTGSTAYSLSAGGPVLAPDVDALLIIPICAHSLHSRPLVVSASSKICINLRGSHSALASVDGSNNGALKIGDGVTVTKSARKAKFLFAENENFYAKLLNKMNVWGTTDRISEK